MDTISYLKLPALLVPGTCFSLGISPTFLTIPCQPFMHIRKGWWSIGLSLDCLLSSHCSFSHSSPRVQSHRISSQLPIHVAISCYSLNISTGVSRLPDSSFLKLDFSSFFCTFVSPLVILILVLKQLPEITRVPGVFYTWQSLNKL